MVSEKVKVSNPIFISRRKLSKVGLVVSSMKTLASCPSSVPIGTKLLSFMSIMASVVMER